MRSLVFLVSLVFGLSLANAAEAQVAKPFFYKEGECRTGNVEGELKYVGTTKDFKGVPVMILEGTPEEKGRQAGSLALRQAKPLLKFPRDYFQQECTAMLQGLFPNTAANRIDAMVEKELWPKFEKVAGKLEPNFPKPHLKELEALSKAGEVDREQLIASNGMFDLGHIPPGELLRGCTSVIIPARHSNTQGLLFGRNLDFSHFGYLYQYSLLTVYKSDDPKKKHSFASAGFPGFVGCFTGMNDAGLTIASHEVEEPEETTTRFNPKGVPFGMAYRRILEECATIAEALALLDSIERASVTSLVIADAEGGAVIEVTPDSLAIRRFKDKPGVCTNHFCSMKNPKQKDRFETLTRFNELTKSVAVKKDERFGVDNVQKGLHGARLLDRSKADITIQTFVFEPAKRLVHLRFGDGNGPATKGDLTTIDLKELWGK